VSGESRTPFPFQEAKVRVISVLFALAILVAALLLIPATRRGMLVAAENVSVSMPRMR
jgi:hypothetical protein